jgi:hypothetical protein
MPVESDQPWELTPSYVYVSRAMTALMVAGYLTFCLELGSGRAFVGFIPYLLLAAACTCFPRELGRLKTRRLDMRLLGRLSTTPAPLVLAGGWLLLLLPAVAGFLLWLSRAHGGE